MAATTPWDFQEHHCSKAKHPKPFAFQPRISLLIERIVGVLSAIALDDDATLKRDKVSDVVADRLLTLELGRGKSAISQ
jgi:hypothetical protein